MARNDCVIFKIFLKDNDTTEIKKFTVDGDTSVVTNYFFMKQKLEMIFPRLREASFKITWRDSDGDDITIESDEDLIMAFTEMENSLKTLYVTILPTQYQHCPQYTAPHANVVCDVCNKAITAYRYKCLQCYDYDLCADCEHAGQHSHHAMLRTSTPDLPFARSGRKIFEHVNKAVRKANSMAYKECKKRWQRGAGWERRRCDQQPTTTGESSKETPKNQKECEEGAEGECPFQDYVPHILPMINAFAGMATDAANATMSAAAASATNATGNASQTETSQQPQQQPNNNGDPTSDGHNAAAQFMEAIRNAFSAFTVYPPPNPDKQPQQQEQQPPATPSAPNATGVKINLATSPDLEPMDFTSTQREPGWTILSSEESQRPPLTPTVVPPPTPQQQPQSAVAPQPQITPQPTNLYPTLTQQSYNFAQIEDPRIAVGMSQLMDMGFSDHQRLIALLKRYNGDVDAVVRHLFENK